MIELIHKYPIAIKIMLTVVTLAFIGTGGWFMSKEDTGEYAAKVGEMTITPQEYDNAHYRIREFYSRIYQGNLPPGFIEKMNLEKKAMDMLVDNKLVLLAAAKEGVSVSNDEISDAVTSNQSFKGPDGRFSKKQYEDVVKSSLGMTPVIYEKKLREELTVEKFRKIVKDSVYVTDDEVLAYYQKQMASQNKPFVQAEFEAKKMELFRELTANEQDKAVASFIGGLKKSYEVKINPRYLAKG